MAVAYHFHHDGRTTLRRLYTRLTKDKKQRYHAIGWWCSTCGEQSSVGPSEQSQRGFGILPVEERHELDWGTIQPEAHVAEAVANDPMSWIRGLEGSSSGDSDHLKLLLH